MHYDISLRDHYFIVREWRNAPDRSEEYYIVDASGKTRLSSDDAGINWFSGQPGGVILMARGPYVGIADLDGNWLVKTLAAYLADDQHWRY